MDSFSNEYALLAMQSALLREVTPALRAVTLNVDKDEEILYAHFYYDGEASEQRIDLWDCVICEASADLGANCFVEPQIKRLDYPQKIPLSGYCAYLRKEHDVPTREGCPKVKIAEVSIGYALLTIQHALLGVVTPELRAVVVDFTKEESLLYVRFYYDGEVPKQLIDLWQSAIQEAKEDLGSHCLLDSGVERADYPNTFPFRGRYAYFRKE
jgi:hypothetical protein